MAAAGVGSGRAAGSTKGGEAACTATSGDDLKMATRTSRSFYVRFRTRFMSGKEDFSDK